MRSIILLVLVYLVFLLQAVILPVLKLGGLGINLFVVLAVILALFRPVPEFIFWSIVMGFLADYLSASPASYALLIVPLIALIAHYGVVKFWGKPTIGSSALFTGVCLAVYQLVSDGVKFLFAGHGGDLTAFFVSTNISPKAILLSLALNCFIVAPALYLLMKRLQELFEYWETRKKFKI